MPPKKSEKQIITTNLRLPIELHAAVSASAEADKRSLNKQIETLLAEALAKRKKG